MLPLKAASEDGFSTPQIDDTRPALKLLDECSDLDPITPICLDTFIESVPVKEITR
jgi:hypothetical protein